MRLSNEQGEAVYYNCVSKGDKVRYVVQAASGQTLPGRDRQKLKSRVFVWEHQARRYLDRLGYTLRRQSDMRHLNRRKEQLFRGCQITYRGKVYWANLVTMEIYAQSVEAQMTGAINGYKVANITPDWKIVKI